MKKFLSVCALGLVSVLAHAQTPTYLPCQTQESYAPCAWFTGLTVDGVNPTAFSYLAGITSSVQNQLNAIQALFSNYAPTLNPQFSGVPRAPIQSVCNADATALTTEGYINACAGTSGGGIPYPGPTLYAIPFVSATTPATFGDSPLVFNSGTGVVQTNDFFQAAAGTGIAISSPAATSTSNPSNAGFLAFFDYWNGGDTSDAVSYGNSVCASFGACGATPSAYAQIYGPENLPLTGLVISTDDIGGALNLPPPAWISQGFYDNGGTPAAETCGTTYSFASGSQPNITATHGCSGSTGSTTDVFSQVKTTGGGVGISNNGVVDYGGATSLPGSCNTGDTVELTNAAYSNAAHETCWNGSWVADGPDMVGTPSIIIDTGAGTSPTVSFVSGAWDKRGWVSINPGTSPVAAAGVITIKFNTANTYPAAPVCTIFPANPAASAIFATDGLMVPQSSAATTSFVIYATTALVHGTAYVIGWECGVHA